MSHSKFDSDEQNLSNNITASESGLFTPLVTVDEIEEWINGSPVFCGELPSLKKQPIPDILYELPYPHPDRPRGSSAMLHAHGARHRLGPLRAGAWTIAPRTTWHFVKAPSGKVEWIPNDVDLPLSLYVPYRNAV